MNRLRKIVDSHCQKYEKSCSPSLIEILLKVKGMVGLDYYELQNKYKDENVGLTDFRDKEIEGLHVHCHDESNGKSFLNRLQELWEDKETVALYCVNPDGSGQARHGWIVDDIRGGKIYLLSKYSELGNGEGARTAEVSTHIKGPKAIQITDLIFGTISKPK